MGSQVQVDPAALVSTGGLFDNEYKKLVSAITAFQQSALGVNGAFGVLGPSLSVLQQYEKVTEDAFKGLDQLAKLLTGAAQALVDTAGNYGSADTASTMSGG